jgi:hypothetical protein
MNQRETDLMHRAGLVIQEFLAADVWQGDTPPEEAMKLVSEMSFAVTAAVSEQLTITPFEANALLYALDEHVCTDRLTGRVPKGIGAHTCLTRKQWQDLRDRLMAYHDHPPSRGASK